MPAVGRVPNGDRAPRNERHLVGVRQLHEKLMQRHWNIAGAPDAETLVALSAIFASGGIVLMPSDTVYGLHASSAHREAQTRIADLKERDARTRFIVLCAGVDQLLSLGIDPSSPVIEVLGGIWPAPLTAILPVASSPPDSLAVRIPALPWLLNLLRSAGPLISTSANRSGEPPIRSPSELPPSIFAGVDGVVDSGPRDAEPSMIVDFTQPRLVMVREGEKRFTQKVWKTLRKSL